MMYFSHDTVLQAGDIEIDQQAYAIVPALELRQKLRFMNRNDLRDRLDLDDNALLDQQVDAIGNVQYKTVVLHGLQNFATNGESSLPQLVRKAYLIGRLQQSWSQYRMNLDGGVDDLTTYVVDLHATNECAYHVRRASWTRAGPSLRLRVTLRLRVKPNSH